MGSDMGNGKRTLGPSKGGAIVRQGEILGCDAL